MRIKLAMIKSLGVALVVLLFSCACAEQAGVLPTVSTATFVVA